VTDPAIRVTNAANGFDMIDRRLPELIRAVEHGVPAGGLRSFGPAP